MNSVEENRVLLSLAILPKNIGETFDKKANFAKATIPFDSFVVYVVYSETVASKKRFLSVDVWLRIFVSSQCLTL